jgi:hypothetical protein
MPLEQVHRMRRVRCTPHRIDDLLAADRPIRVQQ